MNDLLLCVMTPFVTGWLLGVWTMRRPRARKSWARLDDREFLKRRTLGFWIR